MPAPPVPDLVDSAWIAESDRYAWLADLSMVDTGLVRKSLERLDEFGLPDDLADDLAARLRVEFQSLDVIDDVLSAMVRFIDASRSPTGLVALFGRDPESLTTLVKVFATSEVLTDCLVADPESFDLLRVSDGEPAAMSYLVDELSANLSVVEDIHRASVVVREFATREMIRIAFGEFVRGMVPEQATRQLAFLADAVVQASLDFVIRRQLETMGAIQRLDGSVPQFVVIGLGGLGAEELTYGDNLDLVVLCDQIDRKNASHVAYYNGIAGGLLEVLRSNETMCFQVNAIQQPRVVPEDAIVSVAEAINVCESSSQIWRRLAYVRARHVAGVADLSQQFLGRLQPWIYRRFLTRDDLTEFRTLRRGVQRKIESNDHQLSQESELRDVATDAGSRNDIRLTVRFLQLLHGGEVPEVRTNRTQNAIDSLQQSGCITHQEATLLTTNYARLTRLEHQLSIIAGTRQTTLPAEPDRRQRLAWQLGVRDPKTGLGDAVNFERSLDEILSVNRRIIGHLISEPDAGHPTDLSLSRESEPDEDVPLETELMLDPNPDPATVAKVLGRHGFVEAKGSPSPHRVMQDLVSLATETSSFLSPRRCRHFFAALVPKLLAEIAKTPEPSATLDRLVGVADSIGAKATLWELLQTNTPTLQLMVRLCAGSPYLSQVLMGNPGMIDELVDSLVIDRVPSAEKLDAQSMLLCRGAIDLETILQSFKDAAHLTAGVHQILGKVDIGRIHALLTDTADCVIRRVIEFEQERLAQRFGDPVTKKTSEPAELVALAFGRLGGREKNYHSDLDVLFLYTAEGETVRRIGGPRGTTTNDHFFNELTKQTIQHVNADGVGVTKTRRLYELDSRLRPTDEEDILSVTLDTFARRFRQDVAPLWQRMALCKARPVSGHRDTRATVTAMIGGLLRETKWRPSMVDDVLKTRQRMERAAGPSNLKRGPGGIVDVEMLCQLMTLRFAPESSDDRLAGPARVTATLDVLGVLVDEGRLSVADAGKLAESYRLLRSTEASLRLMNFPQRHEIPSDDASLQTLAYLVRSTPADVTRQTNEARTSIREIYNRIMKSGF